MLPTLTSYNSLTSHAMKTSFALLSPPTFNTKLETNISISEFYQFYQFWLFHMWEQAELCVFMKVGHQTWRKEKKVEKEELAALWSSLTFSLRRCYTGLSSCISTGAQKHRHASLFACGFFLFFVFFFKEQWRLSSPGVITLSSSVKQ